MTGVNKAILVGHLGAAPDIRATAAGKQVATFSVATSQSWRDKATGEKREHTDWHRVVIFNEGLVKIAEQYLKKGSKVYLEGAMQTRKWTDKDGLERSTTEVVLGAFNCGLTLLDRAERAPVPDENSYGGDKAAPAPAPAGRAAIDDEIPF